MSRARVTKRFLFAFAVIALAFAWAGDTRAAPPDSSTAEVAFQAGKAAMAAGDYPKACGLFAASLAAENTIGTLLNLALCHQQIGKVSAAWGEFRAVEQRAAAANPPQTERVKLAHEHAAALQPRVSKLRITVDPDLLTLEDLIVKVDGEIEPQALWDLGVPVDTGSRVVTATAKGKKPFKQAVRVDDEGLVATIAIPKLEDVPIAPPQSGSDPAMIEAVANARARRTVGLVIGGVGLASIAAGAITGVLALNQAHDARTDCGSPCYKDNPGLGDAQNASTQGKVYATVSDITLGVGAVAVVAGVYLVLTARIPKDSRAGLLLVPSFGPRTGGAALTGAF